MNPLPAPARINAMGRIHLPKRASRCVLWAMKTATRLVLFLCGWLAATQMSLGTTSGWTADYNRLLGKYATTSGVKYGAWKKNAADLKALQKVVDAIAQEKIAGMGQKDQLAFYVNAYNAWILQEALKKYPTESVKDLFFTFFTGKRIKVAGEQTSFNSLEKETIHGKFNDPRIHFALNCASQSCPPLNPEAFSGDKLDAQFERLARDFVNSEKGVKLSSDRKTVELSMIFDWYRNDFNGGVLKFINQRRSEPIPPNAKISYQDYDWALNEAR